MQVIVCSFGMASAVQWLYCLGTRRVDGIERGKVKMVPTRPRSVGRLDFKFSKIQRSSQLAHSELENTMDLRHSIPVLLFFVKPCLHSMLH